MLTAFRRNTLEATLQVMRVAVNCRKGQKQSKIIALLLKNTLTRPPIYDGVYPEKHWIASASNPVGVTKRSLFLFFIQLDKMSLKQSTSLKETYFLTIFGNKSVRKIPLESKIESKHTAVYIVFFHFK